MDLSKLSDADLQALQSGDLSKVSDTGLSQLSGAPVKSVTPTENPVVQPRLTDKPNAVGTGFNQGMLRLAGLPVDTVANVIDLGKAALGAPYTAITGKPAPGMLQLRDRADVKGSGENLIRAMPEGAVRAQNPVYEGGLLQTAGSALPTLFVPGSGKQMVAQAATNVAGALSGKLVGDATGSVPLAVLASMAPSVLTAPRARPPETQKSRRIAEAKRAGYVVPPSKAGAGWVNNRLESIAGKAALNQDATQRNQQVTNVLGARSLGTDTQGLNAANLAALREEIGRHGYAPITQLGTVPITPNYANQIIAMENRLSDPTSRLTAHRYPEVNRLASEMLGSDFTGPELNTLIKTLRETGGAASRGTYGTDKAAVQLGKAQVASARALEGLVDEHLMQFGPSNVVPKLQAARQAIAKTHTVEKALNPATGDVNPTVFAQELQRRVPLTGDQKLIGDFALAFPRISGPAAGSPTPGVSATEAVGAPALALAGHMATGNAAGMLAGGIPLLRAPVRNMLLSKWYQNQFAKDPSKLGKMTPAQLGALSQMLLSTGVLEESE